MTLSNHGWYLTAVMCVFLVVVKGERKKITDTMFNYGYKRKVITETISDNGEKKIITDEFLNFGYKQSKTVEIADTRHETISPKSNPPHVVLILADDLGWNDVGWHNKEVKTPNMDNLASNGVILENAYVQPVCSPSRAAILTGKYPHRIGLQWLVIEPFQPKYLPLSITILPQKLKEVGYSTHIVGKWHLGQCNDKLIPTARGFDSFYGLLNGGEDYFNRTFLGGYDFWKNKDVYYPTKDSYNTDLFSDEAVNIIEKNDPEKSPMFLFLPYTSPHFPLQVPKKYEDLYPNVTDSKRRTYLGMVSSLDHGIGKVVRALETNNYMDNTVIIFLSDNGADYHFGGSNYPLQGDKGDLWEGGSKSVGFVYSPLMKRPGCKHKGMIHAVDWFPTILDIAGYQKEMSNDLDGVSQWKYLQKCKGSGRNEFVYSLDDYIAKSAAIRVGDYKFIVGDPLVYAGIPPDVGPKDPNNTDIKLFNLRLDPYENNDIADLKPKMVKMMMKMLDDYRKDSIPAWNPKAAPPEVTQPGGIQRPGWCDGKYLVPDESGAHKHQYNKRRKNVEL